MTEWQDIKTAPKDGTIIILAELFDNQWLDEPCWIIGTAQYIIDPDRHSYRGKPKMVWYVPGTLQDEQGGYDEFCNPTHWMPLPEPPK